MQQSREYHFPCSVPLHPAFHSSSLLDPPHPAVTNAGARPPSAAIPPFSSSSAFIFIRAARLSQSTPAFNSRHRAPAAITSTRLLMVRNARRDGKVENSRKIQCSLALPSRDDPVPVDRRRLQARARHRRLLHAPVLPGVRRQPHRDVAEVRARMRRVGKEPPFKYLAHDITKSPHVTTASLRPRSTPFTAKTQRSTPGTRPSASTSSCPTSPGSPRGRPPSRPRTSPCSAPPTRPGRRRSCPCWSVAWLSLLSVGLFCLS